MQEEAERYRLEEGTWYSTTKEDSLLKSSRAFQDEGAVDILLSPNHLTLKCIAFSRPDFDGTGKR